jgi:hypothetical protein
MQDLMFWQCRCWIFISSLMLCCVIPTPCGRIIHSAECRTRIFYHSFGKHTVPKFRIGIFSSCLLPSSTRYRHRFSCCKGHWVMTVDSAPQYIYSTALVRERTIPTERPPPVSEVSADFCGWRGVTWSVQRVPTAVNLCFLDRSRYLFYSSSSSIDLTRLGGPRSRPTTTQKIW